MHARAASGFDPEKTMRKHDDFWVEPDATELSFDKVKTEKEKRTSLITGNDFILGLEENVK